MAPPPLIFVVDDDALVSAALAGVLESHGYITVTARDGVDALDELQAGLLPSLIILDWMMPRLDGRGFLKKVASEPRFRGIPIVIHSALGSRVRANGVAATVAKGDDPAVLIDAVTRYATAA
jgi:CheY-like chemotaxis protein